MPLEWTSGLDEDDNTTWQASSAYHDDGVPFRFRLRQTIRNDRIEWESVSEYECGGELDGPWRTIEEAKKSCEDANDTILIEIANCS